MKFALLVCASAAVGVEAAPCAQTTVGDRCKLKCGDYLYDFTSFNPQGPDAKIAFYDQEWGDQAVHWHGCEASQYTTANRQRLP